MLPSHDTYAGMYVGKEVKLGLREGVFRRLSFSLRASC